MNAAVDAFNCDDLLAPPRSAVTVAPSDSSPLAYVTKGLWVGGAGNVAVITASGTEVTYVNVPAGTHLRIRVSQVMATGTTATNIVAEY
jgi:hypothetical protein